MTREEASILLDALRRKLNETDIQILIHFAERMELIQQMHRVKLELGMEVLQEEHFLQGLQFRKKEGEALHLPPEYTTALFNEIHKLSVKMQNELRENNEKVN